MPFKSTQATHIITKTEITRWLAQYGIDPQDVSDVRIEIGRHYDTGDVSAWMDVTWWAKNHLGCRYLSGDRAEAATGHSTIPLTSWPALTDMS